MRVSSSPLLAGALAASMAGVSPAASVLYAWEGNGKSDVFTVDAKAGSFLVSWRCERSAVIAVVNTQNGVTVDLLGDSIGGEKLIPYAGRFQLDARGTFCQVTVSTMN